ncbi:MAG: energy-coupled thiamine transporter ThiT [Thermovenabulum sp.]|uniref:energy-coupled thiamine transporter ThiT n=1 Tax=Thermovenabulum sp. TaxID=3100335 RepID=UPI003C7D142F
MQNKKLIIVLEGAIMIAISLILSFVKIFQAPYGGSITLGSMVPIILYSLRNGPFAGIVAGIAYGLLQLIIEPYIVHPVQVILDYPLAFGLLGLSGFFKNNVFLGSFLGIFGRFVSHFLSGVVFFASYAPKGMNVFLYSALYNGSYLLPEFIITFIVLRFVLYNRFLKQKE